MTRKHISLSWILKTIAGSALFALGFDLFLLPHGLNSGGISGLAMVLVELLSFGSVGTLSLLLNLPLFLIGGLKIGKKFFAGSLIGLVASSVLIDAFTVIPVPVTEPLIGSLYGSVLCGLGLGMVFICGSSTGGSDIVVRLLKLRYRNVPIGQVSMVFDMVVAVLTGLVFRDVSRTLYTGIVVFVTGNIIDAVVYRFDYSKVALIVTAEYEKVAKAIGDRLDRGATYLHGQGAYTLQDTKVVLTAIKRRQLAELKELVTDIDPNAFIIVQEAHQVLGDGFARYSKDHL